jgi:hypothetical protein
LVDAVSAVFDEPDPGVGAPAEHAASSNVRGVVGFGTTAAAPALRSQDAAAEGGAGPRDHHTQSNGSYDHLTKYHFKKGNKLAIKANRRPQSAEAVFKHNTHVLLRGTPEERARVVAEASEPCPTHPPGTQLTHAARIALFVETKRAEIEAMLADLDVRDAAYKRYFTAAMLDDELLGERLRIALANQSPLDRFGRPKPGFLLLAEMVNRRAERLKSLMGRHFDAATGEAAKTPINWNFESAPEIGVGDIPVSKPKKGR